jgi:hypothetical protein
MINRFVSAAIWMALLAFSACAFAVKLGNWAFSEVQGQIVDRETKAPIVGAQVLVQWHSEYGRRHGSRSCTLLAAARTDAQGRYSISVDPEKIVTFDGKSELWGGFPEATVYARGYDVAGNYAAPRFDQQLVDKANEFSLLPKKVAVVPVTFDYALSKSSAGKNDRQRQLLVLSEPPMPQCGNFATMLAIKGFYQAIADEAAELAATGAYEKRLSEEIAKRASLMPDRASGLPKWNDVVREASKSVEGEVDARDARDRTALMRAASECNPAAVKSELAKGADPNRMGPGDGINGGYSSLTYPIEQLGFPTFGSPSSVIRARCLEAIQTMVADPRTKVDFRPTPDTHTALMYAVLRGQPDVVELFLNASADPNASTRWESTMELAEKNLAFVTPSEKAIKVYQLLLASPKLTALEKARAVGRAANSADLMKLKIFVAVGVDFGTPRGSTGSALIIATQNAILNVGRPGPVEAVKIIANARGTDKTVGVQGKTALQLAQEAHRADLVQVLN